MCVWFDDENVCAVYLFYSIRKSVLGLPLCFLLFLFRKCHPNNNFFLVQNCNSHSQNDLLLVRVANVPIYLQNVFILLTFVYPDVPLLPQKKVSNPLHRNPYQTNWHKSLSITYFWWSGYNDESASEETRFILESALYEQSIHSVLFTWKKGCLEWVLAESNFHSHHLIWRVSQMDQANLIG